MIMPLPVAYGLHAILDCPPQEEKMTLQSWALYHAAIVRTHHLDQRTSSWELPRLVLIAMLALNTWVIVGLLGTLFGNGFWDAIGWTALGILLAWLCTVGWVLAARCFKGLARV
jgi:hypothetical protein